MIKIIHLVSSLSVGSGVMSFIMNYYRNIDRDNIQFGFMYFKDIKENTYEDEIKNLGGECVLIKRPSITPHYRSYVDGIIRLLGGKYSILHIHELYLGFIFARSARNCSDMKIIGHAHTTKFAENRLSSIRNRLLCVPNRWLLDFMMACSVDAGKTYFGKSVKDKRKFFLVKNAIDINKYKYSLSERRKIRKELLIDDDEFVVGHVGRFSPQKNHEYIYSIIEACSLRKKRYRFILIGDGYIKPMLEKKLSSCGLDKMVLFLGNRNDVSSIYNAMDAFILPSIFEGLGNVLIEAQTNGLPCFVSEFVPEEAIVLSTTKQYPILSDSVIQWVNALEEQNVMRCNNSERIIANSGYDITQESKYLYHLYSYINLC